MNIIITDISGLSIFIMPVVPLDTSITSNGSADSYNAIDNRFRIIDNEDLKTISWNSFLPVNKNYSFVKTGALANGWLYVAFLNLMKKYKLPVRVLVTSEEKIPVLNMLASVDNFSYKVDKMSDIEYSISLTEVPETFQEFLTREKEVYRFVKNKGIQNKAKEKLQKWGLMP